MSYSAKTIVELATIGRASPDGLAAIASFALLSIRRQFNVLADAITAEARGELDTLAMVSRGLEYVRRNAATLHAAAIAAETAEECVTALVAVPGMGLVKAGFVAQMLGHDVACIDSNNAKLFGIGRKFTRLNKGVKPATVRKRAEAYVALCRQLGGSERLWEVWCEYVAETYPDSFTSGAHVSAYHVECVRRIGVPF